MKGTALLLRAQNDRFYDILFRVHAEFQINELPSLPFWFTPACFQGRLIISKNAEQIEYFNLYVPTEKRLNVDMEWLNEATSEGESMEVDIGFMVILNFSFFWNRVEMYLF